MKSSVVAQCKRSCSLNRQNVNSYSMQGDIAAVSVTLIVLGLNYCLIVVASAVGTGKLSRRLEPRFRS